MTRRGPAVAALLLAACSGFEPTEQGAVYLEVIQPPSLTVVVGGTLQFRARALDAEGAQLDLPVTWRTADEGIVSVDATGLVTALAVGTGRVQAVVGTESGRLQDFIVSDLVPVTVRAP